MIDTNIAFITSQELVDLYPNLTAKERENAYVKEHPTTFILQIGDVLSHGEPHDQRAPDYNDLTGEKRLDGHSETTSEYENQVAKSSAKPTDRDETPDFVKKMLADN